MEWMVCITSVQLGLLVFCEVVWFDDQQHCSASSQKASWQIPYFKSVIHIVPMSIILATVPAWLPDSRVSLIGSTISDWNTDRKLVPRGRRRAIRTRHREWIWSSPRGNLFRVWRCNGASYDLWPSLSASRWSGSHRIVPIPGCLRARQDLQRIE